MVDRLLWAFLEAGRAMKQMEAEIFLEMVDENESHSPPFNKKCDKVPDLPLGTCH
jgi:hypothetical protein